MTATPRPSIEHAFASIADGVFMAKDGVSAGSATCSAKKVCFVATDLDFLAQLLYDLSLRRDCYRVKYSVNPRDGMHLGRCFMVTDAAAAGLCDEFKLHPKLMTTIQDDDFFAAYRTNGQFHA
jgi:hypothetical protein